MADGAVRFPCVALPPSSSRRKEHVQQVGFGRCALGLPVCDGASNSAPSDGWPVPLVSRGRIGFAIAGLASSLSSRARDAPSSPLPSQSVSPPQLPSDVGPELHVERAIPGATEVNASWLDFKPQTCLKCACNLRHGT